MMRMSRKFTFKRITAISLIAIIVSIPMFCFACTNSDSIGQSNDVLIEVTATTATTIDTTEPSELICPSEWFVNDTKPTKETEPPVFTEPTESEIISEPTVTVDIPEEKEDPTTQGTTDDILEEEDQEQMIPSVEDDIEEAPMQYFTEEEVIMVAQTLWAECRGVSSTTEKACVAWTIVNRVDAGYANTITGVLTAPNQFAYHSGLNYTSDLYALAEDVLYRWVREKEGNADVGRVLPKDYLWFRGDGVRNYFRNQYSGNYTIWDYSLPSPYEN